MADNMQSQAAQGAGDNEVVVSIRDLHKTYDGETVILKGIDLDVHRGEVVVVLGPSGSGKSTMLRCVNLLETPTSGQIVFEGQDITAKGVDINTVRQKRPRRPRRSPSRSSRRWAWPSASTSCPPSSPAASSSAWPSPAHLR